MLPLTLATEDQLSETIALRLVAEFSDMEVGLLLRRNGNGYLRSRMRNLAEMARNGPVCVLTDLDNAFCPATLREDWLSRVPDAPSGLLLRVAVREVESWLLADHDAVAALLGKSVRPRLPPLPDTLVDPNAHLLTLAKRAPRDVRQDLLPDLGSTASKGLGYNARLCDFARTLWEPRRASTRSPSLLRMIGRIQQLNR
jgi:hypothetical protein